MVSSAVFSSDSRLTYLYSSYCTVVETSMMRRRLVVDTARALVGRIAGSTGWPCAAQRHPLGALRVTEALAEGVRVAALHRI